MTDHTDELAGPSAGMSDVVRTLDMAIDEAMYARTSRVSLHLTRAREVRAELLRLARENAESDDSLSRAIDERDAAQDALSTAHIELGGDGEWVCKMGAAADSPPNSGDLVLDVPALASKVRARAERAEAELAALKRKIADPGTCPHGYPQTVRCTRCGE